MADFTPIPMGIPWDPWDPSLPHSHAHLYFSPRCLSGHRLYNWEMCSRIDVQPHACRQPEPEPVDILTFSGSNHARSVMSLPTLALIAQAIFLLEYTQTDTQKVSSSYLFALK